MAFVKDTKKNGKTYYDLVESVRCGGNPSHRFLVHLGTRKPLENEIVMLNKNLGGNDKIVVDKPLLSKDEIRLVDEVNSEVTSRRGDMSGIELDNWRRRFNIDAIYNTNAIEGSTVTKDETEMILETGQAVAGKSLRELHEVENMLEAIRFVENYKKDLSEDFIKEIHSIVQKNIDKETLGEYKRIPNYISSHYPTHPVFVKKRMREEISWYHRNKRGFHPFDLGMIMHLKFALIHPFTDGNGRTARLVHNFILEKNGFNQIIYSNDTKMQYYLALKMVNEGEIRPFVEYTMSEYAKTYRNH